MSPDPVHDARATVRFPVGNLSEVRLQEPGGSGEDMEVDLRNRLAELQNVDSLGLEKLLHKGLGSHEAPHEIRGLRRRESAERRAFDFAGNDEMPRNARVRCLTGREVPGFVDQVLWHRISPGSGQGGVGEDYRPAAR